MPPTGLIAVERIDQWRVKDPVDRGQETFTAPDNKTYNPSGPPFFRTHLKTHVVSYRQDPTDPDETNLISSELIDEFVIVDPVKRGQETHYFLLNPQDDDEANAQITPDLPDITDTANGVDPPYRTDPFQNIVRLGHQPLTIIWPYQAEVLGLEFPSSATGYHFRLVFGSATPPMNVTLPDGRIGIVTGTFPTVSDVTFNPGRRGLIFSLFRGGLSDQIQTIRLASTLVITITTSSLIPAIQPPVFPSLTVGRFSDIRTRSAPRQRILSQPARSRFHSARSLLQSTMLPGL